VQINFKQKNRRIKMIKKLISSTLAITLVSASSFAMTKQEAQSLINKNQDAIKQSVKLQVEQHYAQISEVAAVKQQIKSLKEDIRINGKDSKRAAIISGTLFGTMIASGILINETRLGDLIGRYTDPQLIGAMIILVTGSGSAVTFVDAAANHILVAVDTTELEKLEATLEQLEAKLKSDIASLES
jgi:hypothetical protein